MTNNTDFWFAKSDGGSKVHITRTKNRDRTHGLCNGAGGYYSDIRILEEGDDDWPVSIDEICSNCRKAEGVESFLVGLGLAREPEAVVACVHVDLKIPKRQITLSDARDIINKVSREIERFEGIDSSGFCVKFNVRAY